MFDLYFGDLFSILTTVLVVAVLAFIILSFVGRQRIRAWGRRILLIVIVGTAISGISAIRDAYMTETALFAPEGFQSIVCSIAGGLIFLTGLIALFVRNQKFRKTGYFFIAVLFILQVIIIEASRIAML